MILLISLWLLLIVASLPLGLAAIGYIESREFQQLEDRVIIAIWIGLISLAIILQALSLIVPLSPLVGIIVLILSVGLPLRVKSVCAELVDIRNSITLPCFFVGLGLICLAAILTLHQATAYDTGLYHYQIMQWLAKVGNVPGMALIHERFGFASSWFTLLSPLNAGLLEARISNVANGFIFLLAACHTCFASIRVLQYRSTLQDWFLVSSMGLLYLPTVCRWGYNASAYPDAPVAALILLIAWSIIVIENTENCVDHNDTTTQKFDPSLITLLFAVGAVSFKLSALPLLPIVYIFYLTRQQFKLRRAVVPLGICTLLTAPSILSSVILSGCPLYPSSLMCFNLPWAIDEKELISTTEIIKLWARWGGKIPQYDQNSWKWIPTWIINERQTFMLIISTIITLVYNLRVTVMTGLSRRGLWTLVVISISGIAFVIQNAPSFRFGMGYFLLLPALLIAQIFWRRSNLLPLAMIVASSSSNLWLGLSLTGTVVLSISLVIACLFGYYYQTVRKTQILGVTFLLVWTLPMRFSLTNGSVLTLILPPKLPVPPLHVKQVNDITYFVPIKGDQCWAALLPCTPELTSVDVKLRNPKQGLRAGFVR